MAESAWKSTGSRCVCCVCRSSQQSTPRRVPGVRRLDFRIMLSLRRGLDLHEVCVTHTTMARLSKFVKHHQLDDVSIVFEMHLPHDFISFQKSDMNAQLSQHRTGDLTWQHISRVRNRFASRDEGASGRQSDIRPAALHAAGFPVACFPASTRGPSKGHEIRWTRQAA